MERCVRSWKGHSSSVLLNAGGPSEELKALSLATAKAVRQRDPEASSYMRWVSGVKTDAAQNLELRALVQYASWAGKRKIGAELHSWFRSSGCSFSQLDTKSKEHGNLYEDWQPS